MTTSWNSRFFSYPPNIQGPIPYADASASSTHWNATELGRQQRPNDYAPPQRLSTTPTRTRGASGGASSSARKSGPVVLHSDINVLLQCLDQQHSEKCRLERFFLEREEYRERELLLIGQAQEHDLIRIERAFETREAEWRSEAVYLRTIHEGWERERAVARQNGGDPRPYPGNETMDTVTPASHDILRSLVAELTAVRHHLSTLTCTVDAMKSQWSEERVEWKITRDQWRRDRDDLSRKLQEVNDGMQHHPAGAHASPYANHGHFMSTVTSSSPITAFPPNMYGSGSGALYPDVHNSVLSLQQQMARHADIENQLVQHQISPVRTAPPPPYSNNVQIHTPSQYVLYNQPGSGRGAGPSDHPSVSPVATNPYVQPVRSSHADDFAFVSRLSSVSSAAPPTQLVVAPSESAPNFSEHEAAAPPPSLPPNLITASPPSTLQQPRDAPPPAPPTGGSAVGGRSMADMVDMRMFSY